MLIGIYSFKGSCHSALLQLCHLNKMTWVCGEIKERKETVIDCTVVLSPQMTDKCLETGSGEQAPTVSCIHK